MKIQMKKVIVTIQLALQNDWNYSSFVPLIVYMYDNAPVITKEVIIAHK